jgi:uncharacterized membrane protein YedE/YeeE
MSAMPLILNDAAAIHWAVAGAAIALITLLLLLLLNRRLGISTGFEDVCSLVVRNAYFSRASVRESRRWRLPFLVGLVAGGTLSALSTGGWGLTWQAGMLDAVLPGGTAGKVAWMFVGGLFIGFGTRLGGGCTSGHGIFGLSNLERPSLVTTLSFMAGGIVTTHLVWRVLLQ